MEQDINVCPRCGGFADNGFSREIPPSPYVCRACEAADEIESLRQQLAAALAACEAKDEALELHGKQYPHMVKGYCLDALAIKPDASALRQHDEALIERCAAVCDPKEEFAYSRDYLAGITKCAAAIRELKGN